MLFFTHINTLKKRKILENQRGSLHTDPHGHRPGTTSTSVTGGTVEPDTEGNNVEETVSLIKDVTTISCLDRERGDRVRLEIR